MSFLSDITHPGFNPVHMWKTDPANPWSDYNTIFGHKKSSTSGSAPMPTTTGQPSSGDYYNPYAPGTDPNRNKDSGLAYGLPFQLRSTWGAYPGVDTLMKLLQNPGQTDSAMFNQALAANSRETQGAADSARGTLAQSGFGNSGLGTALQAAIQQAGTDRSSQMYAQEARRREDLTRSDLTDLLGGFFVNPKLSMYGANKGVQISNSQMQSQKKGAEIGGAASLIGALIAAFACATAEELYGKDTEETKLARFYMGVMADPETKAAYGTGSELAARVKKDPELRREVRPIFDRFVAEARAAVGA